MIMKHAEASKGLLWSCKEYEDGQDFTQELSLLFLTRVNEDGMCMATNSPR